MTTTYLGGLSIGDTVPGAVAISAAGVAGINSALPDLQARIAALADFAPTPVSFATQLLLAQQTLAAVEAAITAGIPVPDMSAQIAIILAQIAALAVIAEGIEAQLDIIAGFQSLFANAGIHGYAFAGATSAMGTELSAATSGGLPGGGPSDTTNAIILATSNGATWSAMSQIFKVSP